MLRVLDLFSGIGGFSLGLERTGGFQTVAFCEIDPFCRKVLRKHWPDVPIFEDVRMTARSVGDKSVSLCSTLSYEGGLARFTVRARDYHAAPIVIDEDTTIPANQLDAFGLDWFHDATWTPISVEWADTWGGPWGAALLTDRNLSLGQLVREVAVEIGRTPSQVAIAWVLAQRARANIIPILGARRVAQMQENLGALSLTLPDHVLERLEQASKIELGCPHEFLLRTRTNLYGETLSLIDDHRA